MQRTPISLGMYTIYSDVLEDMPAAFKKLAALGYDEIEFYGEPEYDVETVRRAHGESGLGLTSWHIEWRNVQPKTIAKTVAYLKEVGCKRAIVPCLGGKWNVNHTPAEDSRPLWEAYAALMNNIEGRLADDGIALGYHNHEHEFQLKYGGETVFDIFFGLLSPSIIMEFDTGNAIEGGADPAAVLKKYAGRKKLIHCKPFSGKAGFDTFIGAPDDLNDWAGIVSAAGQDAIAFLVESESTVGTGMENAKKCIEGLKKYL